MNSCASSLDFNNGAISKQILDAAGFQIQNEAKKNHPLGIQFNDVAVTSSGNLKNCKRLYHITCPSYDKNSPVSSENVNMYWRKNMTLYSKL